VSFFIWAELLMWDHPWAAVATAGVTTLPPPVPVLADGVAFHCYPGYPSDVGTWISLVGTHWTPVDLVQRLEGAWICELTAKGVLVATCVLRPLHHNKWILETLVSRQKGSAYPLINSAFRWLYDHVGPFSLFFTWELSLLQLAGAYFKGWLRAARAVHCTWIWTADCFCRKEGLHVNRARFVMPTVITGPSWSITATDSGLEDGWGYVHSFTGEPDWSTVAKRGGWLFLWYYGPTAPGPLWGFTSQVVVTAAVNYDGPVHRHQWVTAEVASS
jgi:hypothetical protein